MTIDIARRVLTSGGAALIGAAIGWAAQSLTIAGRVEAIERGQQRLETLMMQVIASKAAP